MDCINGLRKKVFCQKEVPQLNRCIRQHFLCKHQTQNEAEQQFRSFTCLWRQEVRVQSHSKYILLEHFNVSKNIIHVIKHSQISIFSSSHVLLTSSTSRFGLPSAIVTSQRYSGPMCPMCYHLNYLPAEKKEIIFNATS